MVDGKSCCAPARDGNEQTSAGGATPPVEGTHDCDGSVLIPGGRGTVGCTKAQIPDDGESPVRRSRVAPFRMATEAVTNAQFAAFVEDTGYVTEADRFGWSFVFWSDVPEAVGATQAVLGVEWWRRVDGANWQRINGPGTEDQWDDTHPVVQVSWNDALAYAAWVGGRLPTEAEWEFAARGGLADATFPWGEQDPNDTEFMPCNIWQGRFPETNTGADGFAATAPARSFEPNGYGLYNMAGNVWEWTAEPFRIRSLKKSVKTRLEGMKGYRLLKGGSFLCHRSYCYRYRIAARTGNSPDTATPHQGFRVVWDV